LKENRFAMSVVIVYDDGCQNYKNYVVVMNNMIT